MRDPARIDRIINKLRTAWKNSPDQRLGQLVMNAVAYGAKERINDIFGVEDEITESGIEIMIDRSRQRTSPKK